MNKSKRFSIIAALVFMLTIGAVARSSAGEKAVITYYDRNQDGIADWEEHRFSAVFMSYALIDSKFTGRYTQKMMFGYPYRMDPVDIPVPRHVKVIRGGPPYTVDQRLSPPKPVGEY